MKAITVALAGNPNAGKTSLFNRLTGARAHVGNYPGVTVEKKEGTISHNGLEIHMVDLPGTYSLTAYSLEELVARDFIIQERPNLVVDVVDAANLERNLYLALQFMEIGIPVIVALNMMDLVEGRGLKIDVTRLEELLGVPVVPMVARAGQGVEKLLDEIVKKSSESGQWQPKLIGYGPDLDLCIIEIANLLVKGDFPTRGLSRRWLAIKLLEHDTQVMNMLGQDRLAASHILTVIKEVVDHLRTTVDDTAEGVIADHRYGFITSVTKQAVSTVRDVRQTISDRIDLFLLNRLLGPLFLLLILYGVYQFTFSAGKMPVEWTDALFAWLATTVKSVLPDGPFRSLLVSGVIHGVGSVVSFVPLIAFMFLAIALLEDSGYMARIAFLLDRVLRTFGLHGNSVLALMIGGGISGGCAVPGVLAARTLRDPKERLATILVTPFMNCGAKLPVFAVLIAAFFASVQARMMFILTLISWGMAMFSARLLRWTVLRGEHTPFVMELPPYRLPTFTGLLIHAWEKTWSYLRKAGSVILAVSILIWALMTYPGLPEKLQMDFDLQRQRIVEHFLGGAGGPFFSDVKSLESFSLARQAIAQANTSGESLKVDPLVDLAKAVSYLEENKILPAGLTALEVPARAYLEREIRLMETRAAEAQLALRYSFAGRLGLFLEKVTAPLGFDWRINIALLGGMAAKEVVLSTLNTAYSLGQGGAESTESLAAQLARTPSWNRLRAFTLMLFVMFYSPCFITLITISREAGLRWASAAFVYNTAVAYLLALIVAVIGRTLGLGL